MRPNVKAILKNVMNGLPRSDLFYSLCRYYVNRHEGINNCDMRTNGEFRWTQNVVPLCKTVFDVGANVGEYTAFVLGQNPRLTVHAFEPSLMTYNLLEKRAFPGDVHLNRFGLSSAKEKGVLYLYAPESGANSLQKRVGLDAVQSDSETIELDTLDAYCMERKIEQIDLLKIDVEGHEFDVLSGASRMLRSKKIKRIQFEYGGTYIDRGILLRDIFDLLVPFGYKLGKMLPDKVILADRYSQKYENYQYQNWIALSADIDSKA